jgi:WD40 repeat protein
VDRTGELNSPKQCRKRIACVNSENVVYLFDAKGEGQDKFKAKGNADAEGGPDHPFTVLCMAYSPDSTRLALGQSDGIVYVYKLGLEWRGKKSISNKFPLSVRSSCTCISDGCIRCYIWTGCVECWLCALLVISTAVI